MRCQMCGSPGPTVQVELNHNVGMLVMRQTYATQGQLCKSCLNKAMFSHTWKNLLFGWWGTISFFLTWVYLFRNIAVFASARSKLGRMAALGDTGSGSLSAPGKTAAATGAPPQTNRGGEITGESATAKLAPFENNVRQELRGGKLPYDIAEQLMKTHGVDFDSAYAFVQRIKAIADQVI